ncbi:MAG: energy transducer TonB [Rhodanobacter sp.]|nr:MAG: energy transducer TonB [Rhodanobacter sp.]
MDTRYLRIARYRVRGAVKPTFIAIIAVIALLAVAAWFLIIRPHDELVSSDNGPSVPVASASRAAKPAPVNVASMGINQLLSEARTAMNEQRYLAPAGNNAFEFYLRALQVQPGNRVAIDALRETFPFAANSAEQAINASNFGEAQRQIDLLARADPNNFTLTILRSKLDAQRKMLDKQQQLALDQQKAQQQAADKAAADKLAAAQLAGQQKAQLAAEQQKAKAAAAASARTAVVRKPAADTLAATPESGTGQTSGAVLVKGAEPRYPREALRARRGGWVLVSFIIDADGHTSDVRVVDAKPRHIFDRSAMDAVSRYVFTPAMRNGVPVASKKQQKIEFKN